MCTLPENQRRVLEMNYLEGHTQREIASRLGVPLSTVKGRVRMGLEKLGGRLDDRALTRNAD